MFSVLCYPPLSEQSCTDCCVREAETGKASKPELGITHTAVTL